MKTPIRIETSRAALLLGTLLALAPWVLPPQLVGVLPPQLVAGTKPGITFGSAGGLGLLRSLFNSPAAWRRLDTLAERMAVWSITLERIPESTANACVDPATGQALDDERLRLAVLYGSHFRRSQRVYRVRYSACQNAGGSTSFAPESEGFAAEPGLDSEQTTPAVTSDRRGLGVLKDALNDAAVYEELGRLEEASRVAYLHVSKVRTDGDLMVEYDLVAADSPPHQWSEQTRTVRVKVFLDLATGSTTFQNVLE